MSFLNIYKLTIGSFGCLIGGMKTKEKVDDKGADSTGFEKKMAKTEVFRALKYLLFACSAGVIQVVSFTLLNEVIGLIYWPAYLIALVLSVIWNFTFNRKFTFRTISNVGIAMLLIVAYYAVFTPLSTWWGDALTGVGWNEYLVLAITMVINLVTEYLFYTFVIYKRSIDSALKNKKNIDEKKQK